MARTYNYSTADTDIRIMVKQITDSIRSDAVVEYFIERGDDFIDSRLGRLYTVPFTSTPPMVHHISTLLGTYGVLRAIKMETTEDQQNWINKLKEDAMEMLDGIMNGDSLLLDSSGTEIAPTKERGITISTEDYQPIFNEGSEVGWEISDQKIIDEQDNY